MDTISRENNSLLPVGGIIVGVIALLLGGYAAISLSKVNRTLNEQAAKVGRIDMIESTTSSAATSAEKAAKDIQSLTRSTQDAFNLVSTELSSLRSSITKLEESAKRPAAAAKKSGEPVVAGPDEYIVKAGDTGMKIASAHGISVGDLQAVNPGVSWTGLRVGQKLKLPKK